MYTIYSYQNNLIISTFLWLLLHYKHLWWSNVRWEFVLLSSRPVKMLKFLSNPCKKSNLCFTVVVNTHTFRQKNGILLSMSRKMNLYLRSSTKGKGKKRSESGSCSESDLKSRKYQLLLYFHSIKIYFSEMFCYLWGKYFCSKLKFKSFENNVWYSNDFGWFMWKFSLIRNWNTEKKLPTYLFYN